MLESTNRQTPVRVCLRCGGTPMFWRTALVPGDPWAPRASHRAFAHHQPAWVCMDCGSIEPHDRRARSGAFMEERGVEDERGV
jgi:hypothetical protein